MIRRAPAGRRAYGRRRSPMGMRLIIALVLAAVALGTYYLGTEQVENPVTGEVQRVALSPDQEIALGLQAAPTLIQQYGGLEPDPAAQAYVRRVGEALVQQSAARDTPYQFEFHLLADPDTVNAFALPGGPIFITQALLSALESEGELAGVLGHEIGHVVGRHGSEQLAKARLTQGLAGAAVIATSDPGDPSSRQNAQIAAAIGQMVNMKYGRDDELESDRLGVRFMADAGYDPRSMIGVMEKLAQAGGPNRQPEFFNTHPNPENRVARIQAAIDAAYPQGVPEGLKK
jgi:beta-barrel assembly-enhancing protease